MPSATRAPEGVAETVDRLISHVERTLRKLRYMRGALARGQDPRAPLLTCRAAIDLQLQREGRPLSVRELYAGMLELRLNTPPNPTKIRSTIHRDAAAMGWERIPGDPVRYAKRGKGDAMTSS